eukprot:scaffold13023_cov22-Tisochrysis_lutea.AAC.1
MPPVPKVAIDRMLRRAANRIGGKQVLKWLSKHAFDPNHPHNALQSACFCASPVLQANRQQVLKWLSQHAFDPNDPHNAPLMELMKAHEATSGGVVRFVLPGRSFLRSHSPCLASLFFLLRTSKHGDEFNLDVPPDVAMEGDRQQRPREKSYKVMHATCFGAWPVVFDLRWWRSKEEGAGRCCMNCMEERTWRGACSKVMVRMYDAPALLSSCR